MQKANQLMEEPAFAWWAPWTLDMQVHILKKMKSSYHKATQKFGIELPKTVKGALEIEKGDQDYLLEGCLGERDPRIN